MRLIDADALKDLEEMEFIYFRLPVGVPFYKADKVWEVIEKAPTIEAELVRHGKWIPVPSSDTVMGKAYACSECGKMRFGSLKPNYCSHCGVKMDKADDEETSEREE